MTLHIAYNFWEHASFEISKADNNSWKLINNRTFKSPKGQICFSKVDFEKHVTVNIGYYIGVDWLVPGHSSLTVAPKLDSKIQNTVKDADDELDPEFKMVAGLGKEVSIDYFSLINQCLNTDFLEVEIDDLFHIDWKAKEIPIEQSQDWLTPLLVIKFLKVVRSIARKGLKKSYYKTVRNLNSKVKGKILIGRNIKQNILRNKLTQTVCQFEAFGVDNIENRLLKKAFQFACSYIDNSKNVLADNQAQFNELANYCRPALEFVSNEISVNEVRHHKPNPFYKEYVEGIHIAKILLKRYGYSISKTSTKSLTTPPYWIDMPKLFELYAYQIMKSQFQKRNELKYHFSTYGNELDFLIDSGDIKMVVDAKYKPLYIYGVNHQDIRQVSGYSRLQKVYKELQLEDDQLIDCLIIYPDIENGISVGDFDLKDKQQISAYRNVYKLGIKLPQKS